MSKWLTKEGPTDVHVLPLNDLREHTETRDCWCQPKLMKHGAMVVSHNSADGRELVEKNGVN